MRKKCENAIAHDCTQLAEIQLQAPEKLHMHCNKMKEKNLLFCSRFLGTFRKSKAFCEFEKKIIKSIKYLTKFFTDLMITVGL
jgi:hypothetical protein